MLKGIPEIIGSDLLKALADMGHGDILVIADHFYPPYSKSPNAVSIQAKGNTAPEMIDAILKLMPLDTEYCATPLEYMVPDADSGVRWNSAIHGMKRSKQQREMVMRTVQDQSNVQNSMKKQEKLFLQFVQAKQDHMDALCYKKGLCK